MFWQAAVDQARQRELVSTLRLQSEVMRLAKDVALVLLGVRQCSAQRTGPLLFLPHHLSVSS